MYHSAWKQENDTNFYKRSKLLIITRVVLLVINLFQCDKFGKIKSSIEELNYFVSITYMYEPKIRRHFHCDTIVAKISNLGNFLEYEDICRTSVSHQQEFFFTTLIATLVSEIFDNEETDTHSARRNSMATTEIRAFTFVPRMNETKSAFLLRWIHKHHVSISAD